MWGLRVLKCEEFDNAGGDLGGGADESFDMAGAVDEVSAGLGFGEPEAVEPAAPAEPVVTTTATDPAAAVDPAAPPAAIEAPRTWRGEASAEWGKLPPVVQQEILKREEDIFRGIEGYKADAAFGNSLKTVLDPYMPTLQQYNIKPEAQVADMMRAHYTLAFGSPQDKLSLVQQIAQDYGIPLDQVGAEPTYVDPQVQALQNELKDLKSRISGNETQVMEAKKAEITQHVQQFAADPANVHFEELADDIARLLRTGVEKTVESAYQAAIWLNPAVRAKEISRQQAEKAEAGLKEAEAKAAAARKATAANVRSTAKGGSATAPLGSMDDTLQETLRNINARG